MTTENSAMNQQEPLSTEQLLTLIFGVSSLAGLTRLLKSKATLTPRMIASAMLSTGLYSLGMTLALWDQLNGNYKLLMGLSILSGIGTQTTLEFIWSISKDVILAQLKAKGRGER